MLAPVFLPEYFDTLVMREEGALVTDGEIA